MTLTELVRKVCNSGKVIIIESDSETNQGIMITVKATSLDQNRSFRQVVYPEDIIAHRDDGALYIAIEDLNRNLEGEML